MWKFGICSYYKYSLVPKDVGVLRRIKTTALLCRPLVCSNMLHPISPCGEHIFFIDSRNEGMLTGGKDTVD